MTTAVHRLLPMPAVSLAILALWAMLAGQPGAGSLLLGTLLGVAIPLAVRSFWTEGARVGRPLVAVPLLARVLADIVTSSIVVARQILGPQEAIAPGFIEVPLDIEDPFVATVLGSIISLTPGTVTIDIDIERRILLVHALHIDDPAAIASDIKARYETPLKEIFAC